MYAQKDSDIYVNLFANSTTMVEVHKKAVEIVQENNYPWDGKLLFTIKPKSSQEFNIMIRIPGWADNEAIPSTLYSFKNQSAAKVQITINKKPTEFKVEKGYAVLANKWKKGDVIEVNLPMEVRRVVASANVLDDLGKVALQRGPIVYCAEWPDNFGKAGNIILLPNIEFKITHKDDLLNGVTVLTSEAVALDIDDKGQNVTTLKRPFTAIPYYAWAHRGKGEMTIWFPEKITNLDLISR
jgi:DUF1680 family protein